MSVFGDFESLETSEPHPGIRLRRFDSGNATVNEYGFDPGASFPLHWHLQEQVTLVLDGEVDMTIEGETLSLATGAWAVVKRNAEHGLTAGPRGARIVVVPRRSHTLFQED
jgi:quercetin dioxygenase-like cupin family protein